MKKISISLFIILLVLVGGYFLLEQKKNRDEVAKVETAYRVYFFYKPITEHFTFNQKVYFDYELYLADKNRPNLKGKLVEKRSVKKDEAVYFRPGLLLSGIEKSMLQMTNGSKIWAFLPANMAFGEKGAGDGLVPKNQDLVLVMEAHFL